MAFDHFKNENKYHGFFFTQEKPLVEAAWNCYPYPMKKNSIFLFAILFSTAVMAGTSSSKKSIHHYPGSAAGKSDIFCSPTSVANLTSQCVQLTAMPNQEVQDATMTTVIVKEFALDHQLGSLPLGAPMQFAVKVSWKSQGVGLLQMQGPEGTIITLGKIVLSADPSEDQILIESFTDDSMTQELDRSLHFQQKAYSPELKQATESWLEEVLKKSLLPFLHVPR